MTVTKPTPPMPEWFPIAVGLCVALAGGIYAGALIGGTY